MQAQLLVIIALSIAAPLIHDVQIGIRHISTGVLVNGGVQIGSESFIGSGAMIRRSEFAIIHRRSCCETCNGMAFEGSMRINRKHLSSLKQV